MRGLNKKEQRLILLFAGTIFFAVNVIGLKRYTTALKQVKTELRTLADDRQNIDIWLSDRQYWEERQHWLDEHEPVLEDPGAAQGDLIQTLQNVARDRGITILDQNILEPASLPQFQEISAKLKISAPMEDLVGWLAEIQAPERFYLVNQLTLGLDPRSKEDDPPAMCVVQIGRVYAAKGAPLRHP